MSSLTTFQHYSNFPGVSIVNDQGSLTKLREMLVLIRIWSYLTPNCLPHFNTMSGKFDSLVQLFSLVTRVWVARSGREGSVGDLEDGLLDESCLLPTQVQPPPVNQGLFGDTQYECSILSQALPVTYTFGEIPSHAVRSSSGHSPLPAGQTTTRQKVDVIRQVNLGVSPVESTKQCTRCACVSLLSGLTKASALQDWDMRWVRACVCGGHWKLAQSNS